MGAYGPIGFTNGMSDFLITAASAAAAGAVQITTYPTQLLFVSGGSIAGAARFIHFYDTAAVATSGVGNTSKGIMIVPGNSAGAGTNLHLSQAPPNIGGDQFNSGLAVAITANLALSDNSGIQGDTVLWLGYR